MSSVARSIPVPSFQALVQAFFAEHLTEQRAMSPRTVAAYRDAFMLFLDYIQAHHAKSPANVKLADLTPELILGFLDHLEHKRHNSVRSRNARLAALRAFLKLRHTAMSRRCMSSSDLSASRQSASSARCSASSRERRWSR